MRPSRLGGAEHDQLIVTGDATWAGTLDLAVIDGFVPAQGDSFTVATYATTGVPPFDTVLGADLGGGLMLVPTYGPAELVLDVQSPP